MSESDIYRRQIQTYKDGPRAARVRTTLGSMTQMAHSRNEVKITVCAI